MMDVKDKLIQAAKEMFFKYGIKSISMEDICRNMGVSKKTIYEIIASKSELINLVLSQHLAKSEEELTEVVRLSKDAIDEMLQLSMYLLNYIAHMSPSIIYDLQKYHPQSWKLVETYQETLVEQRIYNNLVRGQQEMLYRSDFDPRVIAKLYVHKTSAIVDQDLFPAAEFDKALLFKEIIKYHIFGIISEKGLKSILRNYKKIFSI